MKPFSKECRLIEELDLIFQMQYQKNSIPTGVTTQDLALGYEDPYGKHVILENFLQYVRSIEGQVFTGYKGGDYKMNRWTPLWAGNYGDTTSVAIVGVTCGEDEFDENPVVIRTAYID